MKNLLLVTGLVCLLSPAHSATSWLEQPYGDMSFNTNAAYETNVTLHCNDTRIPATGAVFQYWVLPNLEVMVTGDEVTFRTLYSTSGWKVEPGMGGALIAYGIQEQHFGLYHCVLVEANATWVVKKSINLEAPYFTNLIDYYRSNIIIGFSAGLAFLVGAIITVLTYDHITSKAKARSTGSSIGLSNLAMDEVTYNDVIKRAEDSRVSTSL